MKNRILITGSAGFIGYHLCKSLINDNYEVQGVDNLNDYYDPRLKIARLKRLQDFKNFKFEKIDLLDKERLAKIFRSFKPNKVVNLAAQAGVRYSIENPYTYMDSNVVGFLNILELCRENKVEGLIYASSSSVYGSNNKFPFGTEDRVDNPLSIYAVSKRTNELMAYSYSHLYGLNTTGLRFFTVYGPWGRPDMAIFIFTKKIQNDIVIPVFNNGNMKRDFTYIDDIISGTRKAIDKNYNCEIFNLGNNKSEKLMDIVHLIEKNLGKKAIINFLPMQPGDIKESFADINPAKVSLGFKPRINIEIGIKNFIDWYKKYYKDIC